MCRNIKTLYNFDPPATQEEIQASALQYVKKLSGYSSPSTINKKAFNHAVNEVASISQDLLNTLKTNAKPRNRDAEYEKASERSIKRFGAK